MTAPEIQQEIEQTREHLGETVEELAARADMRARARARAVGMMPYTIRMTAPARPNGQDAPSRNQRQIR